MKTILIAGVLAISLITSAWSQTLRHVFDDPTVTDQDWFGSSVALDGNRVLIGASGDDTNGDGVGQAHLFDAITGNLLQTFDDPTPTQGAFPIGDHFSSSVALDSNRILIGAQRDNTNGDEVGQAHLFEVATGNLLQTFDDPSPSGSDHFGDSVALVGNRVFVSAPGDDTFGENAGQVHVFDIDGSLVHTFNNPGPIDRNFFGHDIFVADNRILIGGNDAYLFDVTTGDLMRTFYDPGTSDDRFGRALAMQENRVLIGDHSNFGGPGVAHVFDATSGNLLHTFNAPNPTDNDWFGFSMAMEGNRVLIGEPHNDANGENVGQAHLFDATSGILLQTFNDPTVTDADKFGFSVSLDANHILIGSERDSTYGTEVGQAYLFTWVRADFNGDGLIDCLDIDSLVAEIVAGTNAPDFDLTGDGIVNIEDLDEWRIQGGAANLPSGNPYLEADANLDGVVDGLDFVVWNANKFTSVAAWCSGDFTADGMVDESDFVLWNENKFMSFDGISAVPEPGLGVLMMAALMGLATIRRR